MSKDVSIGVREFAKQVGCSHVLILNLIKAGKMPQNIDKSIPLEEGLIAYENRKKKKTTITAKPKNKKPSESKRNKRKSNKDLLEDEKNYEDDNEDENEVEEDPLANLPKGLKSKELRNVLDIATQFKKAQLAEKTYQAKLKEIEFKLKKGDLIQKIDVEADASKFASELRERLTSLPVRISALCERKTAREIEDVMSDAIQDALNAIYKSKFVKAEQNNE